MLVCVFKLKQLENNLCARISVLQVLICMYVRNAPRVFDNIQCCVLIYYINCDTDNCKFYIKINQHDNLYFRVCRECTLKLNKYQR